MDLHEKLMRSLLRAISVELAKVIVDEQTLENEEEEQMEELCADMDTFAKED